MSDDMKPVERAPKVRTSHHRNKEEAARLQALVDKRLRADVMSDDMVERVARALCEECAMEPFDELSRSKYIGDARMVIAAMREPTTEMLRAATAQIPTWDDDASRRKWQAMIDAALGTSET